MNLIWPLINQAPCRLMHQSCESAVAVKVILFFVMALKRKNKNPERTPWCQLIIHSARRKKKKSPVISACISAAWCINLCRVAVLSQPDAACQRLIYLTVKPSKCLEEVNVTKVKFKREMTA